MAPHTQLRVYDNKLWLWNAGKLPDEITFEKLKKAHLSCPRNEFLADVFFKAGYIEAWGRGTIKIIEACCKANLPDPEFSDLTGGFLVCFSKAEGAARGKGLAEKPEETTEKTTKETTEKTTEKTREKTREKIRNAIQENPQITTIELSQSLHLSEKGIEWNIKKLKKEGFLRRVGPDKGGHWEILK